GGSGGRVSALAALGAGWVAAIVAGVAIPRLAARSTGGVAWRVAVTLALGALFAPLSAPLPVMPAWHRLDVVATGERNPEAQGSEVWFIGLFDGSGKPLVGGALTPDVGWTRRDDLLLASGAAGSLVWRGWLTGDAEARFVSHAWSGKTRVLWDGRPRDLDLFSREGRQQTVALPFHRGGD